MLRNICFSGAMVLTALVLLTLPCVGKADDHSTQTSAGTTTENPVPNVENNEADQIRTLKLSSGQTIVLMVGSSESIVTFLPVELEKMDDDVGRPEHLPYGLFDIEIEVNPGETAYVTLQLPEPAPEDYRWFKYSPDLGWYDFNVFAAFNEERTSVTLELTDGGAGDDDNVINGVIRDPSGLGSSPAGDAPAKQNDESSKACFIQAIDF